MKFALPASPFMLYRIKFLCRRFCSNLGIALPLGKNAPAIILPVHSVLFGKLYRALVAIFLLKSEFKYATPYSSASASPISFNFSAFLSGLMDSVVVK